MSGFQGTDRFRIQRRLGSGSFGAVYEVFDRERQATVALKLPHDTSAHNLYLFKQEFRALADICHPNLASLYELHTEGHRWFYTMELVRGSQLLHSLRNEAGNPPWFVEHDDPTYRLVQTPVFDDHSTQGSGSFGTFHSRELGTSSPLTLAPESDLQPPLDLPTPPRNFNTVRDALRQLASGLNALHEMGKLHRDLKPSNVLVTASGRLVILDFGLVIDMETTQKAGVPDNRMAGTPAYMAPEQIKGQPASDVSDWYSVGVMLYQVLTGRLPFPSNTHHQMVHKLNLDPVAPRLLVPSIPQDLDTLCVALLHRTPGLRPRASQILDHLEHSTSVGTMEPPLSPQRTTPPAVVREDELLVLFQGFRKSRDGRTTTVFLHGDSGMGKSYLAQHFLQEVQRMEPQAVVFQGRCYEQESVPFKALDSLVDSLSHFLKSLPRDQVSILLPKYIPALARLFPVLNQIHEIRERSAEIAEIPDAQEFRHRAFGAFRELLGHICLRQPTVLVIDDLQWGDLDSAALIKEILRTPKPPQAMVLLSYRSDEAETSPILQTLLADREALGNETLEIGLRELPLAQARRLARAALGDAKPGLLAHAERIALESGGNPFFIGELAHHYHQTGDLELGNGNTRLEDYLQKRVSSLRPEARSILETLAVAGYPLEWGVIQKVCATAEGGIASLNALRVGHLVRIRYASRLKHVETYHDRIREIVVRTISPEASADIHLRLALALEQSSSPDSQALALHFEASCQSQKAAHYATLAADQAVAALAFDRAATLFRKALELMGHSSSEACSLWKCLGDALTNAGRSTEAAEAYLKAATLASSDKSTRLQRRAAEEFLRGGKIDAGLSTLKQVLASIGTKLPVTPRQAMISIFLHRLRLFFRGLGFTEKCQDEIPRQVLDKVDIHWAVAMGLGPVDVVRGADFQTRQLLLTLDAGEPYRIVRALAHETIFVSSGGNRSKEKSQKLQAMTFALAERIGQPGPRARAYLAAGIAAVMQGRWNAATELLEKAEGMLKQFCTGMDYELRIAQQQDLLCHSVMGNLQVVQTRLADLLQEARDKGDLLSSTTLRTSLSHFPALAQDDPARIRKELVDTIQAWPRKDFHAQHFYYLTSRANVELYAGELWNAREILMEQWDALWRSLLLKVQPLFITAMEMRARTALAMVPELPDTRLRNRLLSKARKDIRALRAEGTSYGEALALKLEGHQNMLLAHKSEAIGCFIQAEVAFDACDMRLHAAAVRYCRGRLQGDSGREALVSAEGWMRAQGIKDPSRYAAMHVPFVVKLPHSRI